MKKVIYSLALVAIFFGGAFAQGELPEDGLVGMFTFDDANNLEANSVAGFADLVRETIDLENPNPDFTAVEGPAGGDGAVRVGLGSFYSYDAGLDPNGDFDLGNPLRVNQFTLVYDFKIDQRQWYGFHATNVDPRDGDWESFIRSNGRLGVGSTGYSADTVHLDKWYRLVIVADLGHYYRYFLDGQLMHDGGAMDFDGRFSLNSIDDGAGQIYLLGDNDGEDAAIDCSNLAVYNRALSYQEIVDLGGYGNRIEITSSPVAIWNFHDTNDPTQMFLGTSLTYGGDPAFAPAAGPEPGDVAMSIDVPAGAWIEFASPVFANGGGERTNNYSLVLDVKASGATGIFASNVFPDSDPIGDGGVDNADWEWQIDAENKIGAGQVGFSEDPMIPDVWNRIVMVAELPARVSYYLNGVKMYEVTDLEVDQNFSTIPRTDEAFGKMIFFGDNNGAATQIELLKAEVWNYALSDDEVGGMGGYIHDFNDEITGSGSAYFSDGSDKNRQVVVPYDPAFDIAENEDFTIELWVKPAAVINSDPSVFSNKDWDSGGNNGWNVAVKDDSWDFNMGDGDRDRADYDGPDVADGHWHYLGVIVKRGVGFRFITDTLVTPWDDAGGDFANVGAIVGHERDNPDNKYPIVIGQDGTQNYGAIYGGYIDEARFWKGVAIEPEVLDDWKYKKIDDSHPNYDNLLVYYNFDQVDGLTVADMSGNGFDGTLTNNPMIRISYAPFGNERLQNWVNVRGNYPPAPMHNSGGMHVMTDFPQDETRRMVAQQGFLADPQLIEEISEFMDPYVAFGHDDATGAGSANLPAGVAAKLIRQWVVYATETLEAVSDVTFKISDLGGSGDAGDGANYVLLYRDTADQAWMEMTSGATVDGDMITFSGVTFTGSKMYTLGTKDASASPIGFEATSVEDTDGLIPDEYALRNNYPNPFNPATSIKFDLPAVSDVRLSVFNVLGEEVAVLFDGTLQAGYHVQEWNAANLPSGVYIYHISAKGHNGERFISSQKAMLLK